MDGTHEFVFMLLFMRVASVIRLTWLTDQLREWGPPVAEFVMARQHQGVCLGLASSYPE